MLHDALLDTTDRRTPLAVAKLHGGPYDGWEDWIFRVRTDYLRRVHRGRLARILKRPPRYAWYQLVGLEEDVRRADYVFRGIRPAEETRRGWQVDAPREGRTRRLRSRGEAERRRVQVV